MVWREEHDRDLWHVAGEKEGEWEDGDREKGGISKLRRREAEGCEGGGGVREGENVRERWEKAESMGGRSC